MNKKALFIFLLLSGTAFAGGHYYAGGAYNFVNDEACVGAWGMTNSETTEQDMSDNNEDLSQNGTIPTAADVPTGYSGTSRVFVAADDPHDFLYHADGGSTDIATDASGSLSIVAWVKITDDSADSAIVGKGVISTDGSYFLYYDGDATQKFRGGMTPNATPEFVVGVSSAGVTEGVWTRVAMVSDDSAGTIQIYINGAADGDAVSYTGGVYNNTGVFRVGSFGGSRHLGGSLKDVAVFSRALTADEVSSIYNYGLKGDRS